MNRALSLVVLCIVSASFAHALCADRDFRVYTFGGGFNVVGLEGGDYYQSCCTFSAGCPSAYFDDWCVGTTYKCSCTIKSDECASNITKYLQTGNEGILWLAGSEGYMAYLPLLQPGQFVSGWRLDVNNTRMPEMNNQFYPKSLNGTYVPATSPLAANSVFTMEISFNSAHGVSLSVMTLLALMSLLML